MKKKFVLFQYQLIHTEGYSMDLWFGDRMIFWIVAVNEMDKVTDKVKDGTVSFIDHKDKEIRIYVVGDVNELVAIEVQKKLEKDHFPISKGWQIFIR